MTQDGGAAPIFCATRRQLADEFAIAARLYAEAVVLLTRESGTMARTEYARLREAVDEARQQADSMGMAFDEHVESHQCGALKQQAATCD